MEAHAFRAAILAAAVVSAGANYPTQNFFITAHSPQLAQETGDSAERFRRDLAVQWLGKELPAWRQPCPVTVMVGPNLGAGGATSFMFDQGHPFGWQMTIQGSRERLLDSVLPHEITHMILATHFGRPLPRWADEGAATTVEHSSERAKQDQMLISHLTTGRGIAFNHMFAMREYPQDVLPLYSQGYSLSRFLIGQGGRHKFVDYVREGMASNNWTDSTRKHYGFSSLSELQVTWVDWVRRGSPQLQPAVGPSAPRPEAIAMAQAAPGEGGSVVQTALDRQDHSGATASEEGLVAVPPLSAPANTLASGSHGADLGRDAVVSREGSGGAKGWYVRQRDHALAGGRDSASLTSPQGLNSAGEKAGIGQQMTRPQTPQQPQQIILQESSPPAPAQLSAPPVYRATIWR